MAYFRCMGNGSGVPTEAKIERLCSASENSTPDTRSTDHTHIAYFDDGVGTITEDANYNEYLYYDTGKFTVLKDFVAFLVPWTYNYNTASGTNSTGALYINNTKVREWTVQESKTAGYYEGKTFAVALETGDTFYVYTPSGNGYPQQNLKVYNMNVSADSVPILNDMFNWYSTGTFHLEGRDS